MRTVKRSALTGGVVQNKGGRDGPSAGTVRRLNKLTPIVVDAPGYFGPTTSNTDPTTAFPVKYEADFALYAVDVVDPKNQVRIDYTLKINKTSLSQPDPINDLTVQSTRIAKGTP